MNRRDVMLTVAGGLVGACIPATAKAEAEANWPEKEVAVFRWEKHKEGFEYWKPIVWESIRSGDRLLTVCSHVEVWTADGVPDHTPGAAVECRPECTEILLDVGQTTVKKPEIVT
jgi:hypothetical protein